MNKILITGSKGFVGKNLIRYLNNYSFKIIEPKEDKLDLKNPESWNNIEGCEYLIHLAGKSYVPESWKEPGKFIENNILLTTNALEYCRRNKAKLIFLSSYLYGNSNSLPIRENNSISANNPYALTKILSEKLCNFYKDNFHVSNCILRVFNLYGPEQPENFLFSRVITQVKKRKFIEIESLHPKRDYIYIDDLCSAIVKSITYKGEKNIFNIGFGKSYSVKEVIDAIQETYGTSLEIIDKKISRKNEILNTVADIKLANDELGWNPNINLKEGIRKIKEFT